MKIRLNHYCHLAGAEGQPGDVVDVSEKLAAQIIRSGGATKVGQAAAPKKVAAVDEVDTVDEVDEEAEVEAAIEAPPENAARRTVVPHARKRRP